MQEVRHHHRFSGPRRIRRLHTNHAWVMLGLLGMLPACSALVDPDAVLIKCELDPSVSNEDPCGGGMRCVGGACKPCKREREICNGIDDDCDGVIDDGHDEDRDGFTWCGGGVPELADCAPADPAIHPSRVTRQGVRVGVVADTCDGKDNDCDSKIDEDAQCPKCVDVSCPAGLTCEPKTGVCIAPLPIGSTCASDAECDNGFCIRASDLSLNLDIGDSRCASACCSDSDCGAEGLRCVIGSTGARVCLPSAIAAAMQAPSGASCGRDADCSSGVCDAGRCASRCYSETACGGDTACVLKEIGSARRWLCAPPAGWSAGGEACIALDPLACRSGFCRNDGICARPCAASKDCSESQSCGYVNVPGVFTLTENANAMCDASSAVPEPACCTNADCATGQLCGPKMQGRGWTMVCRAK